MVFIDSSVPMYLVGSAHPHKDDARRILETLISDERRLVTDVEVMQEILHRYVAINRRDAIQPALDGLLGIVDEVFEVERADVQRAKEIVLGFGQISARNALHLAVMQKHGVSQVLSFDRGFDEFPAVTRLG